MSLPNSINPLSPLGTDSPSLGDDELRGIKQYMVDVLGVPNAISVTAAPFSISSIGVVTVLQSPLAVYSSLIVGGVIQTGSATVSITTPGGLLDLTKGSVAGEVRGDLLTRQSAGWARLAAGVSGTVLQSAGAGADLIFATPLSGTGVSGMVAYYTSPGVVSGISGMYWVVASARLLIGGSPQTPISTLEVAGDTTSRSFRTRGMDHITGVGPNTLTIDQQSASLSRFLSWGATGAIANGSMAFGTLRSNGTNSMTPLTLSAGVQVGSPSGGDKGLGTLNVASYYYVGGTVGLSQVITLCGGTITVVGGIVTSTTC